MPAVRQNVGISSSVAVFLLIISVCCVLSLSSREFRHGDKGSNKGSNNTKSIVVPSYIPNIALICVMMAGIIATVIFVSKNRELTVSNDGCQLTTRHDLHRKYSLYSMTAFFLGVCTINVNYLIVEFCCTSNWFDCRSVNSEFFVANVVIIIFHVVGTVFDICEVVVCCMMKHKNFSPSQWVWHLVAVVQAANIAIWFHLLNKESYHRTAEQNSLSAYFSFCNNTNTTLKNDSDPFSCSETSSIARWFLMSAPILFPITIEFKLLVTETLLDRSIGAESHKCIANAGGEYDQENEMETPGENPYEPNDQTPLVGINEHSNTETNSIGSIGSKMFNVISFFINLVHFVLCMLVFLGCNKHDHQPQHFNDAYMVYKSFYYLFLTICCVVGLVSSRQLKRQHHSHNSFLEYLLLFTTSGILFQAIKEIVAFSVNGEVWLQFLPAYYMAELLDVIHVTLQIVLYYYVKDLKLQSTDNACNSNIPRVKSIIFVLSMSNLVQWILNSFIYPHMTACITPRKAYVIESWPVFDNVVIPMYIFFRFNSVMLFWSVYTDVSRPSDRRQGGVASIQLPQETARPHGDAPAFSHSASWPSNRLRRRQNPHRVARAARNRTAPQPV